MKHTITFLLLISTSISADKFDFLEFLQPIREPVSESYDFIVIGSGSAGSVIANRLSEVKEWNILLLEAGEEENQLAQIPIIVPALQFTPYNWKYFMEYQPSIALGCRKKRMPWPRGKALGGTTVINYMIYTRGQKYDFDRWAEAGNPGWAYEDVLPYFIKSEKSRLKKNVDYNFHGVDGYLSVEDAYLSEIAELFLDGMNQLGYPTIDYHGNLTLGVSTLQGTTFRGKRLSVAQAFLRPVSRRNNLHILTKAFVTRVLINPETLQAYGVEYEKSGIIYKVEAKKEVILSAGTFHSPQLLMLSGIGPQDHLIEMKIPVLKNLPVGLNLQDHFAYMGLTFKTSQPVTIHFKDIFNPLNYYRLYAKGTGPLTSLGGTQAIAYIKTDQSTEVLPVPDIELIFAGLSPATDYGLLFRNSMGFTDEIYKSVYKPLANEYSFTIVPSLLHPKSKGFLRLSSKDPHDRPRLYGNFLTDPNNEDIDTLFASIRFVQKLMLTAPFYKYNVTFNSNVVPNCKKYEYDSEDYWRCCLRTMGQTLHHQVGTAKMGPKTDPTAVVDHELKVHGIGRLRVADCSVIPFSLGAHTNAPAIMVGEKAADLMKSDWIKK